jgi:queuine tRNA-ribosyltransferase
MFKTTLLHQHPRLPARVTNVVTAHGSFTTPAFMPVGTRAYVNYATSADLIRAGSQIILGGNTYHMLCSPGLSLIEKAGGMHKFMNWQGPMLTDSGGFQVFSLSKNSKLCVIKEDGAHFKHPVSGEKLHLTPASSIHAQKVIGADIIMAFDECTPEQGGETAALAAMQRTDRWLQASIEAHLKHPLSIYGHPQALFGIIQGGSFRELRERCTEKMLTMPVDGIAIGGQVIGFDMEKTKEILSWVTPLLPHHQTRYTMGVGLRPSDLIDVVAHGIDIFDCVAPTRNARHGSLYCGSTQRQGDWVKWESTEDQGRILIKKAIYAADDRPIMENCECYTCQHHSRAYLHFLFKEKSIAFMHLASIHNIHVMQDTCQRMRNCIQEYSGI